MITGGRSRAVRHPTVKEPVQDPCFCENVGTTSAGSRGHPRDDLAFHGHKLRDHLLTGLLCQGYLTVLIDLSFGSKEPGSIVRQAYTFIKCALLHPLCRLLS